MLWADSMAQKNDKKQSQKIRKITRKSQKKFTKSSEAQTNMKRPAAKQRNTYLSYFKRYPSSTAVEMSHTEREESVASANTCTCADSRARQQSDERNA